MKLPPQHGQRKGSGKESGRRSSHDCSWEGGPQRWETRTGRELGMKVLRCRELAEERGGGGKKS